MPAIPNLVFDIAALQKEPRFFVALFVEIMQQRRVSLTRKLGGQFVQTGKNRQEIRFGIGPGYGLDGVRQMDQDRQQFFFSRSVHTLQQRYTIYSFGQKT